MRLSDLLGCPIVTESGEKLGHVYDVRVARDPRSSEDRVDQKWELTALVLGRRGLYDRLGFNRRTGPQPLRPADTVPWSSVRSMDDRQVTVADGTEAERDLGR